MECFFFATLWVCHPIASKMKYYSIAVDGVSVDPEIAFKRKSDKWQITGLNVVFLFLKQNCTLEYVTFTEAATAIYLQHAGREVWQLVFAFVSSCEIPLNFRTTDHHQLWSSFVESIIEPIYRQIILDPNERPDSMTTPKSILFDLSNRTYACLVVKQHEELSWFIAKIVLCKQTLNTFEWLNSNTIERRSTMAFKIQLYGESS